MPRQQYPFLLSAIAISLLGAHAHAQSLNIRWGSSPTTPPTTYAAAGLPGTWNSFQLIPDYERRPLAALHGAPTNARLYQYGPSSVLAHDNPTTTGNDALLMDSMVLSQNNPVDCCYWVEGLMNGSYEVLIYALTPNNSSLFCRTRVDFASPGPTWIGGAWPGQHTEGVTFSRFSVTISNGVIGLHSGQYNAFYQSGINGVQIKFLGVCPAPTLSQPPSPAIVAPGGGISLSVAAQNPASVPGALTFLWHRNGTSLANDARTTGATSPALIISGALAADTGSYTCTISNACSAVTAGALVTVRCTVADVAALGGAVGPDGILTADDVVAYLAAFFANDLAAADIVGLGGSPSADGSLTADDLIAFLAAFFAGC
ncbi:MAG: GC-type dockerin domain-anchored protein [Phycisphaerales bacterium]